MTDLVAAASEQLAAAGRSAHGRDAHLLVHDGALRQTMIALTAGTTLAEHNSPHAASLHVLVGRVQISGVEESEVSAGHLVALTHQRHAVLALEDSVFVLTAVTGLDAHQRSTT
jgi:quercetin dioxygenase-like cupin family protein